MQASKNVIIHAQFFSFLFFVLVPSAASQHYLYFFMHPQVDPVTSNLVVQTTETFVFQECTLPHSGWHHLAVVLKVPCACKHGCGFAKRSKAASGMHDCLGFVDGTPRHVAVSLRPLQARQWQRISACSVFALTSPLPLLTPTTPLPICLSHLLMPMLRFKKRESPSLALRACRCLSTATLQVRRCNSFSPLPRTIVC